MKILKSKLLISALFSITLLVIPNLSNLQAQKVCGLLPCEEYDDSAFPISGDLNEQVGNLIKVGVSSVFVLIVLYGVIIVVQAALKIIRSNGDQSEYESGQKMIKGAVIGIGMIFAGIIGLIMVLAFFSSGGVVNTNINVPDGIELPLLTE